MKKLLIAAFAIAVATVAQAGAISWNVSAIAASPAGAYVTTPSATQYMALLFVQDTAAGITVDGITSKIASGTDVTALAEKAVTMTYNGTSMGALGQTSTKSDYVGEVTAFVVILDGPTQSAAKNYLVAKKNGEATITQTFGTSGNKTFAFGTQAANTTWAVATPEPTSGLMLLLGVGLMALKRKRA